MTLEVFLGSRKAGSLFSTYDRGVVFAYSNEYLSDKNSIPLSASLPLCEKEYSQKECMPFFSGLLPEETVRRRIADFLHISETSTLKLLEALGGECAGLITIGCKEADSAHKDEYELSEENYESLSQEKLEEFIRNIPFRPFLKSDEKLRLSLAGAQEKLPLAYFNGEWHLPKNGAPSTHIIKPSRSDFPDIAENEYLCMKLAQSAGLDVPNVGLFYSNGKSVYVVERYDRIIKENKISRVHQEDMCQALGIQSELKYQADGGPSLCDIYNLIKKIDSIPVYDMKKFTDYFIFNYLIGNCDCHGKNFSFLYKEGSVRLAPLYDVVSTVVYPALTTKLSMKIGKRYELAEITKNDFSFQAELMGIKTGMILNLLEDMKERLLKAFEKIEDDFIFQKNKSLAERIKNRIQGQVF